MSRAVEPGWWNWQTRMVEGHVLYGMQVQILSPAFSKPQMHCLTGAFEANTDEH
jgi:hypothetical protein